MFIFRMEIPSLSHSSDRSNATIPAFLSQVDGVSANKDHGSNTAPDAPLQEETLSIDFPEANESAAAAVICLKKSCELPVSLD
jgi:hypothetical protein